jgi:serine/threonine protein kinase
MKPDTATHCPECGKPLPTDSPQQVCPACLMAQAFASRTEPAGATAHPDPSPPPSPEEIADKFPLFEITECLGRGGMGVVYKARQKSLNRWVAIKILAPERVGDEKFAERFTREARTLAQLNHPNIVTVYDHGETDGLFYIVMEYVDGVNLRDLLHDGKIESSQALSIVPPICEALQYAHDKGIVHRDIKPENLLIDREGRIKIADFGIAALVGASDETTGTPPYMAPEQGEHANVDHRADIYALGAVLYEMLTGERPATPLNLPSQKVQLDIRIDDIVLRALNKEPELRYRSANDFRTMVETVTPVPAQSTSPPPQQAAPPPVTPGNKTALDPLWRKGLGIAMIVAGGLNALVSLGSIIVLPIIGRVMGFGSRFPVHNNGPFQNHANPGQLISPIAGGFSIVIIFGMLLSLGISVAAIVGGRHFLNNSSRNWTIIGAIACCLIPLAWPLGLIIGIGAIVVMAMENNASQPTAAGTPTAAPAPAPSGPQLSAMAVIAAILVSLPLLLLFFMILGLA